MEKFITTAARTLDRRSFFRGLGRWGMGAAAVAGVLMLPKKGAAQIVTFCGNNGGPCSLTPVGGTCGHNDDKICISREPDNLINPRCQCVAQ